jgi:hypothetical protein
MVEWLTFESPDGSVFGLLEAKEYFSNRTKIAIQ